MARRIRNALVVVLVLGDGRPLVLVHGFASDAESWFPFMRAAAAEGFKVYALDLLGFGDSEKPDIDYAISRQVEAVRQFLDSQGLQKVELGGISMGGSRSRSPTRTRSASSRWSCSTPRGWRSSRRSTPELRSCRRRRPTSPRC